MSQDALFEHRFWLQILGDHARFIYNALSPVEQKDAEVAKQYMVYYDQLLDKARHNLDQSQLMELNKEAKQITINLRSFKLNLLERLLVGKVVLGLTPTFINHMVNELNEYVSILDELLQNHPVPRYNSLHYDLIWLLDAAGHAAAIAMELDAVEKRLIQKSEVFEKHFTDFYLKAIELTGYMQKLNKQFPAIGKFHKDVNVEMAIFMAFLKEVEALELSHELLSRLNPLVPDHMYREECYYLMKLAQSGDIQPPHCNPAQPRLT